jgi:DNA repair exonuclease SbcCD ATPase subunit
MEKIEGSAEGSEEHEKLKAQVAELGEQYTGVRSELDARKEIEEKAAMKAQISTLTNAIEELKKPGSDFQFAGTPDENQTKASPYVGVIEGKGQHSFFEDVRQRQARQPEGFRPHHPGR